MLKLFGARPDRDVTDGDLTGRKFSRFETEHARRVVPQKAVAPEPEARPTRQVPPVARNLVMAMRHTDDTTDQLHSEVGLTPNILRNALPQRFEQMDQQKAPALGADFFERAASA